MRTRNTGVSKLAFLLVAIVLAFVAVMAMSGIWPPDEGNMSGTIAPAQRYQSDQISDADVVLGDESVAKIMQTDEFEQLRNNPELAAGINAASANDAKANRAVDGARMTDEARASVAVDGARAADGARASVAVDGARAADEARASVAVDGARAADEARASIAVDGARAADGAKASAAMDAARAADGAKID